MAKVSRIAAGIRSRNRPRLSSVSLLLEAVRCWRLTSIVEIVINVPVGVLVCTVMPLLVGILSTCRFAQRTHRCRRPRRLRPDPEDSVRGLP